MPPPAAVPPPAAPPAVLPAPATLAPPLGLPLGVPPALSGCLSQLADELSPADTPGSGRLPPLIEQAQRMAAQRVSAGWAGLVGGLLPTASLHRRRWWRNVAALLQ